MDTPKARIKLSALELIEKSLLRRTEDKELSNNYNFDISVNLRVNPTQKTIIVLVDIDIREFEKELILARIGFACGFEIENFDEVIVKQNENQYVIPPDIESLTRTVSISTVRGVMYSEFRGTYLANANLPIIILNSMHSEENQESKELS